MYLKKRRRRNALVVVAAVGSVPATCGFVLRPPHVVTALITVRQPLHPITRSNKRYKSSYTVHNENDNNQLENQEAPFQEWEANGSSVHEDLDRLERAIAMYHAEQDLLHKERLHRLDDFCHQRRPLFLDIHNHIVGPMCVALAWTVVGKTMSSKLGGMQVFRPLWILYDVHFWVAVVSTPLILWAVKHWQRQHSLWKARPRDARQPETFLFLPPELESHDNPRSTTATDDYTLCLLEQVSTAVLGTAILGSFLSPGWTPLVHFWTRLGAMVAWYQYPKLYNDLVRSDQPRPVSWDVTATRLAQQCQGMTTWMLVPALVRVMMRWKWRVIAPTYGYLALAYLLVRWKPRLLSGETKLLTYFRTFAIGFSLTFWFFERRKMLSLLAHIITWVGMPHLLYKVVVRRRLLSAAVAFAAMLLPLIHLAAFRKLVRVANTSNVSLAMSLDEIQQATETESASPTWRWRLAWREPHRVADTLRSWWRGFFYRIFLAGSVEEKLYQERLERQRSDLIQHGILAKLRSELKNKPQPAVRLDRDLWKSNAMERLKEKHAKDYAEGKFDVS
jgi:hypothetical protein